MRTTHVSANGRKFIVPCDKETGLPLLDASILNEMAKEKKGYALTVGGFSFLGEGSGPYANHDDHDPEPRAELVGEIVLAGYFNTLDEAEEAGEMAISKNGYNGVHGDNYVIPQAAGMRFLLSEFAKLGEEEGGGSYCCGKRMVLAPSEIVYHCLKCGGWEYSSS